MKTISKKSLAALLILCLVLCLLTACANGSKAPDRQTPAAETETVEEQAPAAETETAEEQAPAAEAEAPDAQAGEELLQTIFEANQLEPLFSRHESMTILFSNSEAPDGYDVIWQTADAYFQTYSDWYAVWAQDQVVYQMYRDTAAGSVDLLVRYDYDDDNSPYSMLGDVFEEFYDAEHETFLSVTEEDGRLILSSQYDESMSRQLLEDQGLEYTGQTVYSRLTVDAENYDVFFIGVYLIEDGEEHFLSTEEFSYDRPEPFSCLTLRAAIDRTARKKIKVSFLVDPGTDHEQFKSIVVPGNTDCWINCGSVPYVYFYDLSQTTVSGWDRMHDITVFIYTNPDEALSEHFQELYDATDPKGLVLKDELGNTLKDGDTLSGHYYYKVYVEDIPEEAETIETAWARGDLDADEHEEWAERKLHTDEHGRYIRIVPVVGADYTQETMFARLDEDDEDVVRINFLYDRETVRNTAVPELLSLEDPKVGQTDYVLRWKPVEGAEFYEVLWYTPSGNDFYYGVDEPEFFLSDVEGALDEVGEYTLYILPYGDGMPFTYGAWTSDVTE